jgi:hypothetical protein
MVTVKLKGGLGNQMFQYAAGRALAEKHHVPLLLDVSFLEADAGGLYTKRHYELDQLNIVAKVAGKEHLKKFKSPTIFQRLFKNSSAAVYHEQKSSYNKAFENLGPDVYLDGFWQTEKYFSSVRALLLKEFTPAFPLTGAIKVLADEIKNRKSVAIHVRRGDYVNLKSAAEYHGTCSMDYYDRAINYIKDKVEEAHYYIFSDDMAWCRENFRNLPNVHFTESQAGYSSVDLYLMSCCSHNIIANSSYSWWSAWLNTSEDKIVIAPEKWFAAGVAVNEDLLPSSYIKL